MEKQLVFARVYHAKQIDDIIRDLLINNVECKRKIFSKDIKTKNVVIRCVVIPLGANQRNYTKGLRSIGCFGFSEDATNYLTRGNNVCNGYTLVEYITKRGNKNEDNKC